MSMKTWRKEFYPSAAIRCQKEDATAHSLRKWRGLTKANLKKHGIVRLPFSVIGTRGEATGNFGIDADSCALCRFYYRDDTSGVWCGDCPLYKALGNMRCDDGARSPWRKWANGNPQPMIRALEKTLKMLENMPRGA